MKKPSLPAGILLAALAAAAPARAERTVVLFLIDGLQPASAKFMAQNGAASLKFMFDSGVVAEKSFSPYPKEGHKIENGSAPWGNTSPGNVCVHNGCHIFETKNVDDIFLAARERGIKSVFAGGTGNYSQITTPDYEYAGEYSDQAVVQYGIDHFKADKARLLRLHPQRIRDGWSGPSGMLNATSAYNKAILAVDAQLGRLIQTLKDAGAWDSTYLMVAADHGMNDNAVSLHDANFATSWVPFIAFRGPGIKKGQTIPYAELSDLAIMANFFMGSRPLKGVLDANPAFLPKEPTGSFLSNIFEGQPRELNHPRYVERFLTAVNNAPKADYVSYRNTMLPILRQYAPVSLDPQTRRFQRGGDAADFALRADGAGRLRLAAPFAFGRVDVLGLDGRTNWSGDAGGNSSLLIPALPGAGVARVFRKGYWRGTAETVALVPLAPSR